MRHHIYTLDDYDPEPDSEVIMVKVIPGTYEEQLASLTERLANIDRWIERMEPEGATGHSYARYSALCNRRENVAEHVEWLKAVLTVMTPNPEPPTDGELAQWHQERFRAEWGDGDRFNVLRIQEKYDDGEVTA